jgi:hypothetical protein
MPLIHSFSRTPFLSFLHFKMSKPFGLLSYKNSQCTRAPPQLWTEVLRGQNWCLPECNWVKTVFGNPTKINETTLGFFLSPKPRCMSRRGSHKVSRRPVTPDPLHIGLSSCVTWVRHLKLYKKVLGTLNPTTLRWGVYSGSKPIAGKTTKSSG